MILVTGGSGFLGRFVVEGLVAQNLPVRVFSRGLGDWRDQRRSFLRDLGVEQVTGDLQSARKLKEALNGCNAVVNLAGSMSETREASFHDVHVEGVRMLVELSEEAGIQRFVHVSCLGASQHTQSRYFRAKWEGEQIVRSGSYYWTVFRPSFMFGDSFQILDMIRPVLDASPVIPVIGAGLNVIRPIWVADVAACVVQCIYNKKTVDKMYPLAGPDQFTQAELLQFFLEAGGKSKQTISLPSGILFTIASLVEKLWPDSPVSPDLVHLLAEDSDDDPEKMQAVFQVSMMSLDQVMPTLICGPAGE